MCLAIPGKVVQLVSGKSDAAIVDVAGVRRKVQLGLLSEDMPVEGDWVLIHVGFAMSKISECDADEPGRKTVQQQRGYGVVVAELLEPFRELGHAFDAGCDREEAKQGEQAEHE